MITPTSHELTADGLRLHALVAGSPSAPPVLLLHGWPTHAELYRHVLPALADAGRFAIALDLPGFGRSDKPLGVRYDAALFSRAIDATLASLGVGPTGLVVHDLGGPIGLYWASLHPDRVTSLALLNTLVGPELSWAVKLFGLATFVPGVNDLLASPRGVAWCMRFGVADKARITPEVARLYSAPFEDRRARKALLLAARGIRRRELAAGEAWLHAFTGPLRLVYGTGDRILPDVAETMARVARHAPQAEVTALSRCGHFLQEDLPDEVARLLAAFFADDAATHAATTAS